VTDRGELVLVLFVGDDWAEDDHDIELQDEAARVLARARLPEGIAGITRVHALIGQFAGQDAEPGEVAVGIETDRGLWVTALRAAGYTVYAINPRQVSRYRERHGTSGAKSDKADAHTLADMVRTDFHQLRPVAGDSAEAEAIKVAARAHQTLIWERTRQVQRLRHQLREYFPAALEAFEDLDAPDALELLARAPEPARAARLTRAQVAAALKRARRRDIAGKTDAILAALHREQLGQPPPLVGVYAATVSSLTVIIAALNGEIAKMEQQVTACFRRHPDAAIYLSQPGTGEILGARQRGEFGDTRTVTPAPRRARTTPPPSRSPASPARRRSCWPGSSATTGSPTPCTGRRKAPCEPHPAPAPSTTSNAIAAWTTTLRCGPCPTGWSGSCTAA
jgi:transposase